MGESVKAVLFDVDGTLVDTTYLHAVSWWEAFAQAGHEVPMAWIHRAIGMGSDQLLDALLPAERETSADAAISAAHGALYSVYWSRLRPLPGARGTCCGPVASMACGSSSRVPPIRPSWTS
jgi:beta-phosphoglucomutase-like phosphatase (HAD superfamily)